MIRRISMAKKPAAATKSAAKKSAARTVKAKTPAAVVTLKHIAAEIAEAHEVPKVRAESMLSDTVDRLAKHLAKGNKVAPRCFEWAIGASRLSTGPYRNRSWRLP